MRGRYRRPPRTPRRPVARGGEWAGVTRAAGRKTCCKINVFSSRFSAEREDTYFATACRKGNDNSVVPPLFSFPLHPLSSLLLVRGPYGDDYAAGVKVAAGPGDGERLDGFFARGLR